MTTRAAEGGAVLALYAALFGSWKIAGGSFVIAYDLWQFLPWPSLLDDLRGSLWDLHAQPPLLNLVLGLALKLAVATGTRPESWLGAVQFALGAITVAGTWFLSRRLVERAWLRCILLVWFVANPYFYGSIHFFFYTVWDSFFLVVLAVACLRFFERPSLPRLVWAITPACLLVYTRSLFHPIWLALLVAGLIVHARPRLPAVWPRLAAAGALALLAAAAWPAKNAVRFGVPGFSSWQGYNFSRGLVADLPLQMKAFLRRHDTPPDPNVARAALSAVPASLRHRPALAGLMKPDGSPNWNHHAVIGASRSLGRATREILVRAPWLLVLRAADYYLNGYAVYEGRDVYSRGYVKELDAAPRWARAYERATMLPFRSYDPHHTRLTTGFAILFPLLLAGCAATLWRRRRRWDEADRSIALMGFCVVWSLLMVLGVDGAEGNRMRFETQPFLVLIAGWTIAAAVNGLPGRATFSSFARRATRVESADSLSVKGISGER